MPKYRMLRERLLGEGVLAAGELEESGLIDRSSLLLAHTPEYLEAVFAGTLSEAEQRRLGFAWSEALVARPHRGDRGARPRHPPGPHAGRRVCQTGRALRRGARRDLAGSQARLRSILNRSRVPLHLLLVHARLRPASAAHLFLDGRL